jgi:hypothetical protein
MLLPATRSAFRLMLLTRQRRSEVAEAEQTKLQPEGSAPVWTIPVARTKNGLLHRVPLRRWPALNSGGRWRPARS